MKKRMLITGYSGLLGSNLAYCLRNEYDLLGVYHSHQINIDGVDAVCVDLASGNGLVNVINDFNPDIVIHCAAQANVDTCEHQPIDAEKINVLATKYLVKALENSHAKYIYISTDLVYDGHKGNFSEEDDVNPLNFYGQTKLQAEEVSLKRKNALIARTNFFGWSALNVKRSLAEWAINQLKQKQHINGFVDCHFSSIYTFELAKIINAAIKKDLAGVYNIASSTSITKYDYIIKIAKALNLDTSLISPIEIDAFGLEAQRSKNLSLNVSKLEKDLGINIPTIEESIDLFIQDYKKDLPNTFDSYIVPKNIYPNELKIIPYGRQSIDDEDIATVVDILKSDTITQGEKVNEFQLALCKATDAKYAVVVNSGTSALHIACLAAGIGDGDEVITSPNTFVASANCAAYCGAAPIFSDIHPQTYNITAETIQQKITAKTKAIIPVHFAGQSCDMEAIKQVVADAEKKYKHKIYIIEDASHALGSIYKGAKVGSCAYSDMAVTSFHPVKHITTGEGGVVFTHDQQLRRKLSYFRSHGITNDPEELIYKENAFENDTNGNAVKNIWYYEQNCLGYNYRITDIQCALGISQLKKLNQFMAKRKETVIQYNEAFRNIDGITIPFEHHDCQSNFHLYVLLFDFKKIGMRRSHLMAQLRSKGVFTQVHYIPVHTQPFYQQNFGTKWGDYPVAEQYYEQCLSIPLHPQLTETDKRKVIDSIKGFFA